MPTTQTIVIIIVVVAPVALALRSRFGPEYDLARLVGAASRTTRGEHP